MKRQIKIIGVRPYQTTFNGNTYVGTKYYYVFNEPDTEGNGCDSFKIPFARVNDFPRVKLGDEFTAYIERSQHGARLDDLVPLA